MRSPAGRRCGSGVTGDVVLTRVLLFAVAWVAQWLLATGVGSPGFRLDIWRRWDASLYLDIAQRGYAADVADGNAAAFFPLYPPGVRALAATGLGHLEAALLLSALSTLVACVFLYRLAEQVTAWTVPGRRCTCCCSRRRSS